MAEIKARYKQLRDRQKAIERELSESNRPNDEFDHEAWLMCEHESLRLEREHIEQIQALDGTVEYE